MKIPPKSDQPTSTKKQPNSAGASVADTDAATRIWYEAESESYSTLTADIEQYPRLASLRQRFWDLLPGDRILDVACGGGRDSRWFAENGGIVTACDREEAFLERARPFVHSTIRVDLQTPTPIPGQFDGIWCCATLHHLNVHTGLALIERLAGSIVSRGMIFVSVKRLTEDTRPDGRLFVRYSEAQIRATLAALRFQIVVHDEEEANWITILSRHAT